MANFSDPIPVEWEDERREAYTENWLRELFVAANNLSLYQREGAIQNYDKAGNLDAQYLVWTSNGTANTEDTVPHTLNRVPKGYIVCGQNKAASLYSGPTAWTTTNLYLKSSAASVAWVVMVF